MGRRGGGAVGVVESAVADAATSGAWATWCERSTRPHAASSACGGHCGRHAARAAAPAPRA
jgi:hypothetical protein